MKVPQDIEARKAEIRAEATRRRVAQPDKDALSRRITEQIFALPEFDAARCVLLYVDTASEVRTGRLLDEAFAHGKTVVVPYCAGDELRLFHLRSVDELAPGAYDIREPRPALRERAARRITPAQLDLVVVPGVAFDRRGHRMGHGKGYYDRLLTQVRADTFLVSPAFECQVFDEIPVTEHDVAVHRIVTEGHVYPSDE